MCASPAHDPGFQEELGLRSDLRTGRTLRGDACAGGTEIVEQAAKRRDGRSGTHAAGTGKGARMFARG
jgi:hypothetical protein